MLVIILQSENLLSLYGELCSNMTITRHLYSLHPDIAVAAYRFPPYSEHVRLEHADKQSQTNVCQNCHQIKFMSALSVEAGLIAAGS